MQQIAIQHAIHYNGSGTCFASCHSPRSLTETDAEPRDDSREPDFRLTTEGRFTSRATSGAYRMENYRDPPARKSKPRDESFKLYRELEAGQPILELRLPAQW